MKETRFKDTEIGQIPEDWEEYHLRDLISVLTDFTANGSFSALAENVPYFNTPQYARLVRLTDIRSNFKNSDAIYVTKKSYDYLAKSKLYGGELLLANVGAYAGLACLFPCGMDFVATLAPNMFLIKVNNRAEIKYILNSCNYGVLHNQLFAKASSSAQPKLNKEDVRSCLIPLPTKEEQKRIVSALTSVDNLISSLDKLIEKKENIKQGTMQQLLTGKKRLKGFSDPWVERKMETIEIKNGSILNSNEYKAGNIPVIAGGKHPAGYHSSSNRLANTITISASGANAGYISFYKQPIFASDCSTINKQKGISVEFLYYCLLLRQNEIYKCQTGGAQPHIHAKDIKDIEIPIPSAILEQKRIASIIESMDDEISSLETKKAKFEQIKQGMMQQLLTGKIRLI
ncbi:restriction endonuclease subunit S [Porphyromonas endodontalis]|uniref:restriction endonuclease subunit S n=1 Tax=Porphyromonas endodontalis TaxID=28124 RepID=UPI0028F11AF3|nr:restriction endonuclease subunit S [Porphyromonas endodontalis]